MNGIHSAHAPYWGRLLLAPAIAIGLAACGGGGGTPTPTPTPTASYTVGGTIAGLNAGATVELLDNGGDALSVSANGNFQFATAVQQGGSYAVTVGTQPTGENCSVANATGSSISANVTNVTVTCSPNSYTIGGTISGLATNQQVTLLDNGTDSLTVTANGNFQFLGQIAQGGSYQVTVGTQPAGQTCVLTNAAGSNVMANVSTVTLACRTSYAYVTSFTNPGYVQLFSLSGSGALTALASSPAVLGYAFPTGFALTPNGQYAYIPSQTGNVIMEYAVNPGVGITHKADTTTASLSNPTSTIVDPSGRFLYVTDQTSTGTVTAYTIDQTSGALTLNGIPAAAGNNPLRMATDPLGKYLYVTNTAVSSTTGTISQYAITSTGTLNPVPASPATGISPKDIVVSPTAPYVYVANYGSGTISLYSISSTTGGLSLVNLTAATVPSAWGLAIDPSGKYLYATSYTSTGSVYQFTIGSNGTLTAMTPGSIGADNSPEYLAMDPTGRFLYATNAGGTSVSQYSIGSGGLLSKLNPALQAAGTSPMAIVVY